MIDTENGLCPERIELERQSSFRLITCWNCEKVNAIRTITVGIGADLNARIIYLEALLSRMAKAGDGLTINPKVGDYAEREKAWNKVWLEWKNGTEEEENE